MRKDNAQNRTSTRILQEFLKRHPARDGIMVGLKRRVSGGIASSAQGETMNKDVIETRRFETPDEVLDMKERGRIAIVRMPDGGAGMHAIFEPGWTWEADEKPLLGSPPSCPMRHIGYCLSGRLVVRMIETGAETRIGAGDYFEIPPGHDAYVEGADRVEMILFAPPEHRH